MLLILLWGFHYLHQAMNAVQQWVLAAGVYPDGFGEEVEEGYGLSVEMYF